MAATEDDSFEAEGLAAGFTKEQIKWIDEWFANAGHTHEMDEIEGLEEALGEEVED